MGWGSSLRGGGGVEVSGVALVATGGREGWGGSSRGGGGVGVSGMFW